MTAARRVSAPSSREITAAISRPATPFGEQRRGDLRQLGPGARRARHVLGLVDLVAERDRLLGAQPQEIARRQRADDRPSVIGDAEMADA